MVRQGDDLAFLAHVFGFDGQTVWNDPANAQLRQKRPNPSLLAPTDILYIPDRSGAPPTWALTTGQTNTFVSPVPTITVTIRFADSAFAARPFCVNELPDRTGLTTGADGTATLEVPITRRDLTITFPSVQGGAADPAQASPPMFSFAVGHLDPTDTLLGITQRLQHLGYLGQSASDEIPASIDDIRMALRAFKAAQVPPSDDVTVVSPVDASAASSEPEDDAGLTDDGQLDEATSQMLVSAHGS